MEKEINHAPGIVLASLMLSLAACSTKPATNPSSARQLATNFCALTGQPGGMDTHILLTKDLSAQVMKAEYKNDIWVLDHPGEKPPFDDGILYQSYPDAAPICRLDRAFSVNGTSYIEILRTYPHGTGWQDRLIVRHEDNMWKIDDVLYAPDYSRSLRKTLKQAP